MIIYIDLVILLNYLFDFMILLVVNVTLKRNIRLLRIGVGSLIGEVSLLLLFTSNIVILFIGKIIISIFINIVTFKYKNILYTINNIGYFYMISIILGGFVYYLKLNKINYIVILLVSPFILIFYIRQSIRLRNNYNNYYDVIIYFKNKRVLRVSGFLDTGNRLFDSVTGKSIILVDKRLLKNVVSLNKALLVPYYSLNNKSILKCILIDHIKIMGKSTNNALVGVMEKPLNTDCIINLRVMEEIK